MSDTKIPSFTDKMLVELARDARSKAYAPYSCYAVGAAVRCESGKAYFGCNIENASYPVGICAERVAAGSSIAHGETKINAVALAAGPQNLEPIEGATPCGLCLQFLSEFMEPDGKILIADGMDSYTEHTLGELLPNSFKLEISDRKDCHD